MTGNARAEAAPPFQWGRWLLVAAHVPVVMTPAAVTSIGVGTAGYQAPLAPVLVGLAIGGLQLRHSLAAASGQRPRRGLWTFLASVALVYVPMPGFGYVGWASAQIVLVASAPMVLRGRLGVIVAVAFAILAGGLTATEAAQRTPPVGAAQLVYDSLGVTLNAALLGAFLYGAAQLLRVLDELHATRTELADLAVGRERLRVSRDLHDLLGQSLSAISLKGDLALRLLLEDTQAARVEIEGLTAVACDALRGVRDVARAKHFVSLRAEIDGAEALLVASGITVCIDADLADLDPATEEALAWAVREGVANTLQHSDARTCSITVMRTNGTLTLEIVNDRAHPPAGGGHGLTGLTERAKALSGAATAAHTDHDNFRLLVQIPKGGSAT